MSTGDAAAAEPAEWPEQAGFLVPEAARYLGCSQQTLRGLIRDGAIRAVNLSLGTGKRAHYLVAKAELDRFLEHGPRR